MLVASAVLPIEGRPAGSVVRGMETAHYGVDVSDRL